MKWKILKKHVGLQMNDIETLNINLPSMQEMEMILKYCEMIAKAPSYAAMGGMPGVFAVVMTARELGIGPMAALNGGLHLIPNLDREGKPKGAPNIMMAARTMNMMILKAGHKIEEIENVKGRVTLKGTRSDTGVSMTATMTIDMARESYLSHDSYGKPKMWSAWFKNMDDMLWKTCLSKLARRLFADVIGNAYEPSEFEEKEAKEFDVKPEKKKIKGKNCLEIKAEPELTPIEHKESTMSFDQFVDHHGLVEANEERRDNKLIEYVKLCAEKRNKGYDEMLRYCYDNKEGFLNSYKIFSIREQSAQDKQN
jgi:hypothetical protein